MNRRQLLTGCGTGVLVSAGGCLQLPRGDDGTPAEEVTVSITGRADQPDAPVEYAVELVSSSATADRPARLRVSIRNPTDAPIVLGEERDVQFHHVASAEDTLYLHPASDTTFYGPVEPGCWRLTEPVAVAEYYGTIKLPAGETMQAEAYVYAHQDLPERTCLPEGSHRLATSGVVGDEEEAVTDGTNGTEFNWSFTLQVD